MRVSSEGLALIKRWEGLKLSAYRCPSGVWTIGYGHTKTAREGMTITEQEADRLLLEDLRGVERVIVFYVKVPLTQHQFDALASWVFNVGSGNFRKSTLLKKLNSGDYAAVPEEMMKWVYAKGKRMPGLVNRRAAEAGLWVRGSHVSGRDVPADARPSSVVATIATDTGKGTLAATAAGVAAVVTQAQPVVEVLGGLPWQVAVAVLVAVAVAVLVWRWRRE